MSFFVQYSYFIRAPLHRTSTSDLLYKHPCIIRQEILHKLKWLTQLANQSYDQLLWGQGHLVAKSMPRKVGGNDTVVYHTRAARAFSARMKCRHCSENDSKFQDGRQPAETGQDALTCRLILLNVLVGVLVTLLILWWK